MTSISQPAVPPTGATGGTAADAADSVAGTSTAQTARYVWAALRIVFGFTFLWAFFDKLFGFGRATPAAKGWVDGGSPTNGFLSGSEGPFSGFYQSIAGTAWADTLFMVGLAGIGLALLLGVATRIGTIAGMVLYLMMWSVILPPTSNPVVDQHIVGILALAGLALVGAADTLSLSPWWRKLPVVRSSSWLV